MLLVLLEAPKLLWLRLGDGGEEDAPGWWGVGGRCGRVALWCASAVGCLLLLLLWWLMMMMMMLHCLLMLPLIVVQWSHVEVVIDLLLVHRWCYALMGLPTCSCCAIGLSCETVKITWDACYWEGHTQRRRGPARLRESRLHSTGIEKKSEINCESTRGE